MSTFLGSRNTSHEQELDFFQVQQVWAPGQRHNRQIPKDRFLGSNMNLNLHLDRFFWEFLSSFDLTAFFCGQNTPHLSDWLDWPLCCQYYYVTFSCSRWFLFVHKNKAGIQLIQISGQFVFLRVLEQVNLCHKS